MFEVETLHYPPGIKQLADISIGAAFFKGETL